MASGANTLSVLLGELPYLANQYQEERRYREYKDEENRRRSLEDVQAKGFLGDPAPSEVPIERQGLLGNILGDIGILPSSRPLSASERLAYEEGGLAREDVGYKKEDRKRQETEQALIDEARLETRKARNVAVIRSFQDMVENGMHPSEVPGAAFDAGGQEYSDLVSGIDFSNQYDSYLNKGKINKKGPKEKTYEDIIRSIEGSDKHLITLRKQAAAIQAEMAKPENFDGQEVLQGNLDKVMGELRNRYAYHLNRYSGEKALQGQDVNQIADFLVGGAPPGSTPAGPEGGGGGNNIPVVDVADAVEEQLRNPPGIGRQALSMLANPAAMFGGGEWQPRGMGLNVAGGMGGGSEPGMSDYTGESTGAPARMTSGQPPAMDLLASLLGNESNANAGTAGIGPSDLANKQSIQPSPFQELDSTPTPTPSSNKPSKAEEGPEVQGDIITNIANFLSEAKSEQELYEKINYVLSQGVAKMPDIEKALLKVGKFNLGAVGGGEG